MFKLFSKGDQVKLKLTNLKFLTTNSLGYFSLFRGEVAIGRRDYFFHLKLFIQSVKRERKRKRERGREKEKERERKRTRKRKGKRKMKRDRTRKRKGKRKGKIKRNKCVKGFSFFSWLQDQLWKKLLQL